MPVAMGTLLPPVANISFDDSMKYFGATLNLLNFDISNWTETDGTNGIWLGLGFA